MSKQLDLAKKVFELNREFLRDEMTKAADVVLAHGDLESAFAYTMVFDDGMFDPFCNAPICGADYDFCVGEFGNADDECEYIASCWVEILTEVDPIKYADVINKINDITENGL